MLHETALRHPAAAAVRCDGVPLSYEDLWRRANGLARVLLATGLAPRGRVAVFLAKGTDVPVGFYGALAAGGVLVPIDPKSPAEQVARILRATGATHVVTEPARGGVLRQALASAPQVTHVVGLDEDGEGSDPPFACSPWTAVIAEAGDRAPQVEANELDPAYILHTSGSTGVPKLIQHTHHSALSFVDWAVTEYELTSADRLSNHSSHHTCFATFDYYAAARVGATTVLLTPAEMMMPASLSALLERERLTVWYSVPTALVQLSLRGELEARDLSSIRWVLFAGESFPEKHLRRLLHQLPSARLSHVYGSTETNVCTYYHLPAGAASNLGSPLPIGRACSNARTRVVDDGLREVARGEVGELLVRGSTVMSGYWDEPERNREVLVRQPAAGGFEEVYFRTGDRVRVLEDGNLAFVARADFQVKVRGHRVELQEVEAALLTLDAVEEAAVITVPGSDGTSALHAAAVVEGAVNQREILTALRNILPPHALPAQLTILEHLPRTPTGKVDRKTLRAHLLRDHPLRDHPLRDRPLRDRPLRDRPLRDRLMKEETNAGA